MTPIAPPPIANKSFNAQQIRRLMYGPGRKKQVRLTITGTELASRLKIIRSAVNAEVQSTPGEAAQAELRKEPQRLLSKAFFWYYFLTPELYAAPKFRNMPLDSKQVTHVKSEKSTPIKISLTDEYHSQLIVQAVVSLVRGAEVLSRKGTAARHLKELQLKGSVKAISSTVKLGHELLNAYSKFVGHPIPKSNNKQIKTHLTKCVTHRMAANPQGVAAHGEAIIARFTATKVEITAPQQEMFEAVFAEYGLVNCVPDVVQLLNEYHQRRERKLFMSTVM